MKHSGEDAIAMTELDIDHSNTGESQFRLPTAIIDLLDIQYFFSALPRAPINCETYEIFPDPRKIHCLNLSL